MIDLKEFIQLNKFNLRNIEIDESLKDLVNSRHSLNRMSNNKSYDWSFSNIGNISADEIKNIFSKINDIIENDCLNNTIKINESNIGAKYNSDHSSNIMLVFKIIFFDKNTFDYDVKLITCNRYKSDKKIYFRDVLYYIDINGRTKRKITT